MLNYKRKIIKQMPGLPLFWRGNEGEAIFTQLKTTIQL